MSDIEKIERYIENAKVDVGRYDMQSSEVFSLARMTQDDACEAIYLAFKYGYAKRQRMAQREATT